MKSSVFIEKYHPDLNCESWNLGLSESKIERLRKLSTTNRETSTVDGGSLYDT